MPNGFFADLFGDAPTSGPVAWDATAARLALGCVLGCAISAIYRYSCRNRDGAEGLPSTIILLTMLITMVTLAIGDNAAKAFTLVGTLAIVRFRTPVRDIRDTAFVIFAVAAGIALGAFSDEVAVAGTVVVGLVALFMAFVTPGKPDVLLGPGSIRLSLRLEGTAAYDDELIPVLKKYSSEYEIVDVRAREGELRLIYALRLRDSHRAPALVEHIHALPRVERVALTYEVTTELPPGTAPQV